VGGGHGDATAAHGGLSWSTVGTEDCVARLAALVGVAVETRHEFDWAAIEASLGLRLPDDYKRLVETFPDGEFQGLLHVNRPGDSHQPADEFLGYYAWRLHDMRELRRLGRHFPYPIFPEPGGLLPWASGPGAEPMFWLTGGEDPNAWPVVTADQDFAGWREFPGSACKFLIEVVEGRFDGAQFGVDLTTHGPSFRFYDEATSTPPSTGSMFAGSGLTVDEFPLLTTMIGPPPTNPRHVDWDEIEAFMGIALPSDYRTFIDTYGAGTFGEITITVPGGPPGFDLYQLLRRAIDAVRTGEATVPMPVCPQPGGIVAWGQTADGWTFSWVPQFPDPDRWSVVAYSRSFALPLWDTSFSQFLRKYAEGSQDIADLLGRNPARVAPLQFAPARPRD